MYIHFKSKCEKNPTKLSIAGIRSGASGIEGLLVGQIALGPNRRFVRIASPIIWIGHGCLSNNCRSIFLTVGAGEKMRLYFVLVGARHGPRICQKSASAA